jgi:uncharacterized protein (TIGR04255 family)
MSDTELKLLKAPIIEAVLDIDCDLPPAFDLAGLETLSRDRFRDSYPKLRKQFMQEHKIDNKPDVPSQISVRHEIRAFQFLLKDEKQLVQVRTQGFSFNRLAPYTSLDDYLHEIERTWKLYVSMVAPVQIRTIRLRYINRILLPMHGGTLDIDDYLRIGPRLPDEERLQFIGFFNQNAAVELDTGNQVSIVLTTQPQQEDKMLPLIFDITVESKKTGEVENWSWISGQIQALRVLKNRVFKNTLTEKCLNLFQQP